MHVHRAASTAIEGSWPSQKGARGRTTFPPVKGEKPHAPERQLSGNLPAPPTGLPPPGALARDTLGASSGADLAEENAQLKERLERMQQQVVDVFARKYRSVSGGQFKGSAPKSTDQSDEDLRRKIEKKTRENVQLRRDLEGAALEKNELEDQLHELRARLHRESVKAKASKAECAAAAAQTDEPLPPSPPRPVQRLATAVQCAAQTAAVGIATTPRRTADAACEPVEFPLSPRPVLREATVQAQPSTADGCAQWEGPALCSTAAQCGVVTADAATQADDAERSALAEELERAAADAARAQAELAKLQNDLAAEFAAKLSASTAAKKQKAELAAAAEARAALEKRLAERDAELERRSAELEELKKELADSKRSCQVWSKRCREALLCETTKVLVSCPKVTLALGEKDLPVYGNVDLDDVSKVIKNSLLPKYTAVMAIDEKSGEDIHVTVEGLCNSLVSDIADTLKKKVPAVCVNARRLSKDERQNSKDAPRKG